MRMRRTARQSRGKSAFGLIDPASQQVRIELVFQRDRRDRDFRSLARCHNLRFNSSL
ncbi:hypothetical protein BC1002_0995 [Paraburkholderia atlantica]|uniref:Uncharacterized protein n=1 Tax=Paraburkholderia atlantica TaxID=2654982 RepID=D5W618_PARAM|nr:hypothetical protein BC1002_0995 [Paraburkholderia atlantica]